MSDSSKVYLSLSTSFHQLLVLSTHFGHLIQVSLISRHTHLFGILWLGPAVLCQSSFVGTPGSRGCQQSFRCQLGSGVCCNLLPVCWRWVHRHGGGGDDKHLSLRIQWSGCWSAPSKNSSIFILNLLQDLVDQGSQWRKAYEPPCGGLRAPILLSFFDPSYFLPLILRTSSCLSLFLGFSSRASSASSAFMYLVAL